MATLQDPSELVPQTQSIADVWATDASGISHEQEARWKNLIASFKKTYNSLPLYVARSPGRVNIIGEHIDYSFYDCLPAALAVDVLVAIKPVFKTEKKIQTVVKLSNTNSKKFPDRQFDVPVDETIPIDASTRDWSNYFKSGMRVALEFLKAKQGDDFQYADLEATLDGNVPPGGGVSSSAAFVCACALGIIKSHGYDMRKQDLHDISILSEQAVGVFSGG
ncbi:galactokinase, partial [Ascosphaera atra]